ncbi:dicarboxylate/amino acid:cation symporter [Nocardioides dubius]|uniref:Dicarboxylate/amino acid:cation symporter n=1 Tax=Nocardioides dubius TaxID=317019 RepID=A0ABN1TSG9_9ACTN
MMGGYATGALLVVLGLFAGIYVLSRLRLNFSALTMLALAAGVGVGVVFEGHLGSVEPIGRIYINLLLAIVAPLVIVSILSSITSLSSTAQLRTIGLRSVFWLLLLNALAVLLTLGLALELGLGKGADLTVGEVNTSALEAMKKPFSEVFIDFFPTNIVTDIAENNIIPIIIFSLMLAIGYALVAERIPEQVAPFKRFIDALREVIYKAVGFVIALTPYAVLSLTAVAVGRAAGQWSQMVSLLGVLVLAWVACFVHAYLIGGVLLRTVADVDPVRFYRRMLPAQLAAFTTQSSAGTLPVTTRLLRDRIGVPADIAGFTAPLGTTIGMPGCAGVWPILIAVYGVNGLGLDWGVQDYAVLVLLGILVSVGTAGVPGTATITATTVLTAAGLPLELVAITLPVSMVADMARTLNNVTSAAIAATIVARKEGRLDDAVFASDEQRTEVADQSLDPAERDVPAERAPDDPSALALYGGVPIGACAITPLEPAHPIADGTRREEQGVRL